jgi:hypothetical protein
MSDLEPSPTTEKVFNPELFRKKINQVLAGEHNWQDDDEPANYDALFMDGKEPFFNNIWNKKRGLGLGYIIFHDFLKRVGEGNTFSSTDMTSDGEKLFQKAVKAGLIEQVSERAGLHRVTRWKVVGNPISNLEKIRNDLDNQ